MATIKKSKKQYTQISNKLLNDMRISLKAKGLFSYMDSKPEGWNFTIKSMAKQLKEGGDSISSALKELREFGYIVYHKYADGSGIYELIDCPEIDSKNKQKDDPKQEKSNQGYPQLGKPSRISNKDLLVKKIDRESTNGKPTEEQVVAKGISLGMSKESCKRFYNFYSAKGWKSVLDYVPLLRNWQMNDSKFVNRNNQETQERNWG